ncbi:DUF1385 domain-containing protein [Desulfotomaculum copahuensis]|uniref:Metal-dependent enzyme n=1 Tax=Desulfotomaculum copahuensis TaxID=1838280 RepID=A0A1B7LB95_9FIRM|nr:DUF1385 domain-containing protein [Desulfotomaculum copahuensis]OAT79764.1 hypothetical protein A6M21_15030 [Desulfotomaculum copahuensis]
MSEFQYGGQAVIEGVMMRGPYSWAVAVRRPDDTIVLDRQPVNSVTSRVPQLKWPFLRGVVVLVESLVVGLRALTYSAAQAMGEEEEEELGTREIVVTMLAALGLAVFLFVVLPTGLTHFLTPYVRGSLAQNLVEGAIRLAVFLAYVAAIGRLPDIRRVFQYHGAEHKVINAFEAGEELTPANVQRYSTFHPRCGTSFILIVLVVSIFLFSLLGRQVLWWRLLSRVLLLPVLAGISYELLKLSARYPRFILCRLFIAPGRWLQALTTGRPDDGQVEVAISALGAVLKEGETNVR